MHPRSPYAEGSPSFASLATKFPNLAKFVNGNTIDFKDADAVRELTKTLLLYDFQLDVVLLSDRLCPTVPNRLNYVLWIQDLVEETHGNLDVHGIDIGTGASAIYALLACRLNQTWHMIGLEADEDSYISVSHNVERNGLAGNIQILKADATSVHILSQHNICHELEFQFTMCNPPFYASQQEIEESENGKIEPANSTCTGSSTEMITTGGEVQFSLNVLADSLVLRTRIRWYTTMLGKLSSIQKIVEVFKTTGINNYIISELLQGRTRRWVIGWSFCMERPSGIASALNAPQTTHRLSPRNKHVIEIQQFELNDAFLEALDAIAVRWQWETVKKDILISIAVDTWSRAARRRKIYLVPNAPITMKVRIICLRHSVELYWIHGLNEALWTSFCGKVTKLVRSVASK